MGIVPPLRGQGDEIAVTAKDKAELIFRTHFPPLPVVDISDTKGYVYSPPIADGPALTIEEVSKALRKALPDKAAGPNGISNRVLRIYEGIAIG